MKHRVLTTRANLPGEGLVRLASQAEVVGWTGTGKSDPASLAVLAKGMSAILALGNDRVDAALLDAAGPTRRGAEWSVEDRQGLGFEFRRPGRSGYCATTVGG